MRHFYPPVFALLLCHLPACGESNVPRGTNPAEGSTSAVTPSGSPTALQPDGTTTPASPTASPTTTANTSANGSTTETTGAVVTGDTGANTTTPAPTTVSSEPFPGTSDAEGDTSSTSSPSGATDEPSNTSDSSESTAGTEDTTSCIADHGGEVPSLKAYFADHFAIGAAIDTQYGEFTNVLQTHFNSITAEDQMKFDALQPTEGNFTYGTADQMVNFALSNDMQVRGHALVWHRQTPSWVFNGTRDQVLNRMKNHITNVMQHFKGKVQIWDVVNEAIMDDGSFRTDDEDEGQESGWYGALGESYIAEAFIAARAADPDAKLFYNDYYNYHPLRRQAIYDLLKGLLDAGVPIDGVGLQGHLNLRPGTDPNEQSYHQTVENMETAIEMYASLGLDVQITELDLSLYLRGITYTEDMFYTPEKVTPAILAEQAERYAQFFAMFRKHADVISSVSFWGISDRNTWLSEFSSGRQDFPLLFDAALQPKPAFWAIVDFCN